MRTPGLCDFPAHKQVKCPELFHIPSSIPCYGVCVCKGITSPKLIQTLPAGCTPEGRDEPERAQKSLPKKGDSLCDECVLEAGGSLKEALPYPYLLFLFFIIYFL